MSFQVPVSWLRCSQLGAYGLSTPREPPALAAQPRVQSASIIPCAGKLRKSWACCILRALPEGRMANIVKINIYADPSKPNPTLSLPDVPWYAGITALQAIIIGEAL